MVKVTIKVPEHISKMFSGKGELQKFFNARILEWSCNEVKKIMEVFPNKEISKTKQMVECYAEHFNIAKDIIDNEEFKSVRIDEIGKW